MGVISRKMLPACESFCFFCPELKARSRHPVKWYKKLLAEIFPRSQVRTNSRMIERSANYVNMLLRILFGWRSSRIGGGWEVTTVTCSWASSSFIQWFGSWANFLIFQLYLTICSYPEKPISRRRCGKDDSPTPDSMIRISSWKNVVNEKGELLVGEPKNPKFWPRVCLRNKAKLAKEANTVRAVFESVFHYFDKGDLWSAQHGVAPAVLLDMQLLLEKFVTDWNRKYRSAADECLVQLSVKIGDASPVSDMMAVMLENVSSITVMTRILISAVYRTAQIVAFIPNLTYQNKARWHFKFFTYDAFPEALFHQLLQATVCADHESRIAAHSIFSVVLIPSSVCPHPRATAPFSKKAADQIQRTLSRNLSVFSSLAALFEKLTKEHFSSEENLPQELKDKPIHDENEFAESNTPSMLIRLKSIVYSTKKNPSTVSAEEAADVSMSSKLNSTHNLSAQGRGAGQKCLKMNRNQFASDFNIADKFPSFEQSPDSLMLSSIWAQSICPLNTPQNYKAIAHTYSLVLLFARSKNCLPFTVHIAMKFGNSSKVCKLSCFHRQVDEASLLGSATATITTEIPPLLYPCEDSSGIKQQLLKEFTPADGFPLGAQFFIESCHGFEPSLITTDNDVSLIAFGNQTDPFTLAEETPNLLGVDELLDSVSNKTPQVGRSSVSTPSNMPYNEMAGNCEALLMGKHQKMSVSMSSQAYQSSVSISAPDYMNATYNRTPSSPNEPVSFQVLPCITSMCMPASHKRMLSQIV
ncbi:hypothetical protein WN944_020701 [Citrus x changshan-huyou]|uniref:Uncharacterized protein n=1 Tax=Citrus x changshan-huyou TaxID=2935761 RepID=A0AAP0M0S9_9ROSI